jgi:transposase
VARFFANVPPCVVGMEACCGAHYWSRVIGRFGHTVRLIAPQFVKPYVKSNKNDANDAEAICEAVSRPQMRFVAAKSVGQQDIQSLHRVRSRLVSSRTQLANQIRGLLTEYGIVLPQHVSQLRRGLPLLLEDATNELTAFSRRRDCDSVFQCIVLPLRSDLELLTNEHARRKTRDERDSGCFCSGALSCA